MYYSEIEQSLQQDIREQKKNTRNIQSRKGGKGKAGRVLFPSDFLSKEEKQAYRKAGKVRVYSMFDNIENIVSYEKFKALSHDEQIRHMTEYRKRFKGQEIADGLGIKVGSYYGIVSSLGVGKQYKGTNKSKGKAKGKDKGKATAPKQEVELIATKPQKVVEESVYQPDGIIFGYGGKKTSEDIIKKLNKLELLLDGEVSLFEVEIRIKEVIS